MLKVVHDEAEPDEASGSVLDEIMREAARRMLAVALQAEVPAYIDGQAEEVDENGHRLVIRNGSLRCGDPARMGTQFAAGGRGAAAAVPATACPARIPVRR